MRRRIVLFTAVMVLASGVAFGQEPIGAQRVEIESALFGGGAIFLPAPGSQSMGYAINVAGTVNLNRWTGIEGDFAWALSRSQALALYGTASTNERTPTMLFYTGNLVISPGGHDRATIPYVEVGAGAVDVLSTADVNPLGLAADSTHVTVNLGGGVRWFPMAHWGVRADYRYIGIGNGNPPAGTLPIHHAQRLYGALVLTF